MTAWHDWYPVPCPLCGRFCRSKLSASFESGGENARVRMSEWNVSHCSPLQHTASVASSPPLSEGRGGVDLEILHLPPAAINTQIKAGLSRDQAHHTTPAHKAHDTPPPKLYQGTRERLIFEEGYECRAGLPRRVTVKWAVANGTRARAEQRPGRTPQTDTCPQHHDVKNGCWRVTDGGGPCLLNPNRRDMTAVACGWSVTTGQGDDFVLCLLL